MGENRDWSWVGEDGIEHNVSEDELTFALSSEELPAYTLVCSSGWSEWLPAMQVAELRWALPAGQADTPRKPVLSVTGQRQAPPLDTYKTLKFRAKEIAEGRINPQFESALALSPAPPRVSNPPPNLSPYEAGDSEEPTVQIEPDDIKDGQELAEVLAAAEQRFGQNTSVPPPAVNVMPTIPPAARVPSPLANLVGAAPQSRQEELPRGTKPPQRAGRGNWTWALGGLALVLAGGGAYLVGAATTKKPVVVVTPTPPPPKVVPKPTRAVACAVTHGPKRLGEFAKPELRPSFAKVPKTPEVAIAYGQTSRYAMGLVVNPATLAVKKVFSDYQKSPLLSVTPLVRGQNVEFRLERAASTLQSARTVAASPPFTLGVSQGAITFRQGKSQQVVWTSAWDTYSVPETVRMTESLHAMVLRGGGERGSILIGALKESGQPLGALSKVNVPVSRIGEPAISTSPHGSTSPKVVVALSGGPQSSKGQIYVGISDSPALPKTTRAVETGQAPAFEPAIAAFPNGGFGLQWTEGPPGAREIRLAVFGDSRSPSSPPLLVSGAGVDAHHGALFWSDETLLSLYMVRNGQNHEMWAASLACK